MKRLALAIALLPATAAADVFSEARRVERADLGDLFWSATVSCAGRGDDLLRRQCVGLVAARTRAWAGGTYVVRAEDGAASVTGGQTVVRGCLACSKPVAVGAGEARYIVTRGSIVEGDTGVTAPELARVPQAGAGPVEIVFRLPPVPEAWTQGTLRGYFVELVAWRFVGPAPARQAPAPAAPVLPEQLNAAQIHTAMEPISAEVQVCSDSYGIPGTADLNFEVGGDGEVKHVEVRGDLADTPTARCIAEAVKKASFPKFRRPSMWIHYPFNLR